MLYIREFGFMAIDKNEKSESLIGCRHRSAFGGNVYDCTAMTHRDFIKKS